MSDSLFFSRSKRASPAQLLPWLGVSAQAKHVWHSSIGVRLNLSKAHLWNGAITPMLIIYQHGELWLKLTMKLTTHARAQLYVSRLSNSSAQL